MRAVTIGDEKRVTPEDQPEPWLERVKIRDLVVDDHYQRPLNKGNWQRIKKMAADFRWSRFAPVLVAPVVVDGAKRYAIIDGQHRAHAALLCGFETVPAMVQELGRREQASAFHWVNDQVTRISSFHIYKAALSAAEGWALESRAAVEEAGCVLMTANASTSAKRVGQIFSIALIRKLIEDGKADVVTEGLRALRDYDIDGRVPLYSAVILRPWLGALGDRPDLLRIDLAAFLEAHDPFRVIDRLERMRKDAGKTGKTPLKLEKAAFISLMDSFVYQNARPTNAEFAKILKTSVA